MGHESIVDTSIPNAGRIYDYLLGGHHNFEVDRQAAEQIKQLFPFVTKTTRLQRWCLQDLAVELTEKRGFSVLVDFASGLPTNDHLHHVAPKGTTVIYSDYDPVVVEYAREILEGTPDVYFFLADARRPEELLTRLEVQKILGDQRDIGLIYWGISAFLTEEGLTHALRYLYEWSGPKACLAFNAQLANASAEGPGGLLMKIYESMGSPLYLRTVEKYQELTQPWKPGPEGFVPFVEWHGFDQSFMSDEERAAAGPGGGGYGAYLVK